MFKIFQYLYLASLFKRAKKGLVALIVYILLLFIISFMLNDFISVSAASTLYLLIALKWVSIVFLLSMIAYTLVKIYTQLDPLEPFNTSSKKSMPNEKKEHILGKDKLRTKSDLIVEKYSKSQH